MVCRPLSIPPVSILAPSPSLLPRAVACVEFFEPQGPNLFHRTYHLVVFWSFHLLLRQSFSPSSSERLVESGLFRLICIQIKLACSPHGRCSLVLAHLFLLRRKLQFSLNSDPKTNWLTLPIPPPQLRYTKRLSRSKPFSRSSLHLCSFFSFRIKFFSSLTPPPEVTFK